MLKYRPMPRRTAIAQISGTATAAQFATAALYNNSNGSQILRVWDVAVTQQGAGRFFVNLQQVNLAGTVNPILPAFSNEAPLLGIATFNSLAAENFTQGYIISAAANVVWQWPHDYPIVHLTAGWSFVVQDNTAAAQIYIGITYDWIKPEELSALELAEAQFFIATQNPGTGN